MRENWLPVPEIATHLGVNLDTVYKWLVHRKMPEYKVGGFGNSWQMRWAPWVVAGKAGDPNRNVGFGVCECESAAWRKP